MIISILLVSSDWGNRRSLSNPTTVVGRSKRHCACVLAVGLRGHVNSVQQPRPLAADSCHVELWNYTHESSDESATLFASTFISNIATRVWQTEGTVAQLLHQLIYCDCWSCLRFRQTPLKLEFPGVIPHPTSAWCSQ